MIRQIVGMMSVIQQVYGGYIFVYLFSSLPCCAAITQLSHTAPSTSETYCRTLDALVCWLLTKVLHYQPSCRNLFSTSLSCCMWLTWYSSCRDDVSIANRYGVNSPGIDSRCRRGLPQPFSPALEPIQPPVQRVLGLFPQCKAVGM
jgi:hypothetical protein